MKKSSNFSNAYIIEIHPYCLRLLLISKLAGLLTKVSPA